MIRRPPRSKRTDTLFPTRRSSDLLDVVEKPAVARTEQYHMVGYFGEGAANPQMEDEEARRPALARKGFASRLPRGCASRSRSLCMRSACEATRSARAVNQLRRSAERAGGKECVSRCCTRW